MNPVVLYHVWKRKELRVAQLPGFSGGDVVGYDLHLTTTDQEYAQEMCAGNNGKYVYTFETAYYPS